MLNAIENLRDICRRCRDDSDEQLRWLGRSLDEFLAHRCQSVDEALGLRFARGGIPWWREEGMRKRDAALRELAARHFAGLSLTAQARQVRLLTVRYAASAWRFDRDRSMPAHYADSAHEWVWRAFSSGAPMPIGERQLRHILPSRRPADRRSVAPAPGGRRADAVVRAAGLSAHSR